MERPVVFISVAAAVAAAVFVALLVSGDQQRTNDFNAQMERTDRIIEEAARSREEWEAQREKVAPYKAISERAAEGCERHEDSDKKVKLCELSLRAHQLSMEPPDDQWIQASIQSMEDELRVLTE